MSTQEQPRMPDSPEMEKGVLCSLILSPAETVRLCKQHLQPDSFYTPAHEIIYRLLLEFFDQGKPIEFELIKQALKDSGELENIGGPEFLWEEVFHFISTPNPMYYIKPVLDDWQRRRSILESQRRVTAAFDRSAPASSYDPDGIFASNGNTLKGATILDYSGREINQADTLFGNRFLCRGGGMLWIAPSGMGKSVLSVQAVIEVAIGRRTFGIKPARSLRSLIVQAEDDEGDTIEMARIIDHLKLSAAEREAVAKNTWIEFVNHLSGQEFLAALDGMLGQRPVDLVWINPYSAYLGADIKDDGENTLFLRNGLNPILTRHQCGAIVIHHTPKTNFRNTEEWKQSDWMYAGAGASVMTNWARAIVVVDPTGTPKVYRFIAAKRGQRIGWDGLELFWAHSRDDGKLLWVPADADQIASAKKESPKTPEDLLPLIPVLDPILQEKLFQVASEKGFGQNKTRDFLKILLCDGKAHIHKLKRNGAKSALGYAKLPPTGEECSRA